MQLFLLFLIAILAPSLSFAAKKPLTACEEILFVIERTEAGKPQSFAHALKVEVKPDLTLADLDPETRDLLGKDQQDPRLPLGFQVLMLRFYLRHIEAREKRSFWVYAQPLADSATLV